MASPSQMQTSAPTAQPPTPPPATEPASSTNPQSQQDGNNPPPTTSPPISQPAQVPATSLKDSGKSRRPRDVRLIHLLLASLGVTAYEERVPLQLLDFAYRYTSSILQDSIHLSTEGYAGAIGADSASTGPGAGGRGPQEFNTVSLAALRLSIASRLHYQFQTGLPKEFLMDVAAERNRIALPGASRGVDTGAGTAARANQSVIMAGMRLPPERFCLTGLGWDLKDEWESEGEEEVTGGQGTQEDQAKGDFAAANGNENENSDAEAEGEDEEDGTMEDIFGEDTAMGEVGDEGDGDKDMTDT